MLLEEYEHAKKRGAKIYLVSASGEDGTGNSQLKCYALGALDTFGNLFDIKRIRLSIYQPRRAARTWTHSS